MGGLSIHAITAHPLPGTWSPVISVKLVPGAAGGDTPLASRASGAVAITETVVPKHDVAYDVIHDVTYDVNHEPRAAPTHVNHEPVRPKTRLSKRKPFSRRHSGSVRTVSTSRSFSRRISHVEQHFCYPSSAPPEGMPRLMLNFT